MRAWSLLAFYATLALCSCDEPIVLGDSALGAGLGSGGSDAASPATLGGATTQGGPAGGRTDSDAGAEAAGRAGAAGGASGADFGGDTGLPPPGELVWSTDHEVGDFSDWQRGGPYYGDEYEWGDVNGYVDIGVGRDGSNGVVADINTDARGEPSGGVRLYRRVVDGPAYYSAWFRLEEAHTVSDWWSIFLFDARDDSLSLDNDVSLWDVRVVDTPEGNMALQFFDHDTMQGTLAGRRGRISEQEWFEISAYLDYRPPNQTRVVVWLNGTLLFDMQGLHTAVQSNLLWTVGNGAARLYPADSTLYLDDAAIARAASP